MSGRRLLVVGASVSIGAAIATEAARHGAQVVAAARRKELLDELAESVSSSPGSITPVVADVTAPGGPEAVIEEAVSILGGLDWVVYTPAVYLLRELEELDAEEWRRVIDLNLVGAALVTRAAMPHLVASRGRIAYFISVSTYANPHWAGLASYAVTKVALAKMAECWQYERPEVGFTVVEVGNTAGSDGPVAGGWTAEQLEKFVAKWVEVGHINENSAEQQEPKDVADAVLGALSARSYIEKVSVVPPRGGY